MSQVAAFDDSGLAPSAALGLRAAADRIRTRLRRSVEDIIEIGRDLTAAKKTLGHGNFLPWIEGELGMREDTARNFMRVHKRFGKSGSLPDLKITHEALYLLAAPSTAPEVVEAAVAKADAGGKVGKAEVEEIKSRLKTEQNKARDLRADKAALKSHNERLQEATQDLHNQVEVLQHELKRAAAPANGPVELEVNKYRATLRLVWAMTPPEDRKWFLAEVAPDA